VMSIFCPLQEDGNRVKASEKPVERTIVPG
jgi:hypothetical protein